MTERGLPIADSAPACPFVAFEDDRDERASSPDHRHRCYAEAEPAPRALAHQEAYCLSSAFPVCPTFQDWARREAARSRVDKVEAAEAAGAAGGAAAGSSERNPPRNWAAPPPWASREDRRPGEDLGAWADEGAEPDDEVRADVPSRGRGLSGSYADRMTSGAAGGAGAGAGAAGAGAAAGAATGAEAAMQAAMDRAVASRREHDDDDAGNDDFDDFDDDEDADADEPTPPQARGPLARREQSEPSYRASGWDDDGGGGEEELPRRFRRRERDTPPLRDRDREREHAHARDREVPRHRDKPAPEWERAKPLEAYPTLRSRRMSELSVPPILVAVVALALAAAVLFALPGLLGFGAPQGAASPTPSFPTITAIPSFEPTPIPVPTPTIYIVKSGDTMSRIAGRFGITLDELIAANTETVPDPNKLQIGQEIIIPVPNPTELPAATEIPAAS